MPHRQPEPSDSQAGGVRLTATRSGAGRAARRGRGCGQRGRRQRRARAGIYPPFDLRFDRAARKRRGTDDVPREGGCRWDNRGRTAEEPDSPRGGYVLALRDGFPRYGARGAGTVPAPPARGRFPNNDAGRIAAAGNDRRWLRREGPSRRTRFSPRAGPRLYAARDAADGRAGSASVRSRWTSHAMGRTTVHVTRGRSRTSRHAPRRRPRRPPASPGEHPSAAAAVSTTSRPHRPLTQEER